ncbi:hypothetical protein LSTR_LSTR006816 [Laodelphax striatellus]|uniref:Uncharacterized protein n=1 Tax=Laodelphax striatellus TaxID=195883 RepID=A0A482XEK5_LAOST|nr:hypothetical protein LSTR_LSTR006816 [Laodelphax striatellus]
MSHECDACCAHAPTSTAQTLDEMDFERGIWSAALDGDLDRVLKLLSSGARCVNALDAAGYTALHYAARAGHADVCRALLQAGAAVDLATRAGRSTALHRAALRGNEQVVRILLEAKADPLLQDSDGRTPLHRALEGRHSAVAKLLLDAAPQIADVADTQGNLPRLSTQI